MCVKPNERVERRQALPIKAGPESGSRDSFERSFEKIIISHALTRQGTKEASGHAPARRPKIKAAPRFVIRRGQAFRPSGLTREAAARRVFRRFLKPSGGASVLVNGAVFKTVSEPVRAGSGGFDSHTPPPASSTGKAKITHASPQLLHAPLDSSFLTPCETGLH